MEKQLIFQYYVENVIRTTKTILLSLTCYCYINSASVGSFIRSYLFVVSTYRECVFPLHGFTETHLHNTVPDTKDRQFDAPVRPVKERQSLDQNHFKPMEIRRSFLVKPIRII